MWTGAIKGLDVKNDDEKENISPLTEEHYVMVKEKQEALKREKSHLTHC